MVTTKKATVLCKFCLGSIDKEDVVNSLYICPHCNYSSSKTNHIIWAKRILLMALLVIAGFLIWNDTDLKKEIVFVSDLKTHIQKKPVGLKTQEASEVKF